MIEPTKREDLRDGDLVVSIERHDGRPTVFRAVVFDIDGDTGARSVCDIVEGNSVADLAEHLGTVYGSEAENFYLPVEDGPLICYLRPDSTTLAEAMEAAVGLPASREPPPPRVPLLDDEHLARLRGIHDKFNAAIEQTKTGQWQDLIVAQVALENATVDLKEFIDACS